MPKEDKDTVTPLVDARKKQVGLVDADERETAYNSLEKSQPVKKEKVMPEIDTPPTICIQYTGGAKEKPIAIRGKYYNAGEKTNRIIEVPYKDGKDLADSPNAPWKEVEKPANFENEIADFDDKYGRAHQPKLNDTQVAKYLDEHQDFLNEYLKRPGK
jgi:hypothetical protein